MASALQGEKAKCSTCLHLCTDLVLLSCGHNFCRVCIDQVLNTQHGSGVYSCPECKTQFLERPAVQRKITLCNVEEDFLSTQPHQEESKIFCTYCVDSPVPAVISCLLCEASLCDNHLKVHSKAAEHVLTDPSTSLENRKCSIHKEFLKYYCTKDAVCICVTCSLAGEHWGHRVEILDEASKKRKKKLRNVLKKLGTKRKKTEESSWGLKIHRKKAQEKAAEEARRVTALFIDIRRRLDDLEKRAPSEISRKEEQMSLSLSDVIQKLEIKKDELSRKMRDIEKLCNMTDPLTVLQNSDTGDLCEPEEDGGDEDTGGHDGGDQGAKLISHISHTLSDMIRDITFYVEDPADILLDVNTAANNILISDDLKTATWTNIWQDRPVTAERFRYHQVISSKRFTSGRHYWDVDISRSWRWRVGMCYPSIDRRGGQLIGNNNSWCLCRDRGLGFLWFIGRWHQTEHSVIHKSKKIQLPHQISSDRFRIYLDYEAGQLSFYELCDPIRHLHTFTATFSEPLHAALYVWEGVINIPGGAAPGRNRRI